MAISPFPPPPPSHLSRPQWSFPLLAVITLLLLTCSCCFVRVSSTSPSSGSISDHLHPDRDLQSLSAFCTFQAPDRKCPVPPTVASVDVNAYTGLWFEVATSARFKILSQRGIRCTTANYTADGSGPYVRTPLTIPGNITTGPPSGASGSGGGGGGGGPPGGFNLSAIIPPPEGTGKAIKVVNRAENVTCPVVLEAARLAYVATRQIVSRLASTCPLLCGSGSEPVEQSIHRIKLAAATAGGGGGGGGGRSRRSAQAIASRAEKILESVELIRAAANCVTQNVEIVTLAVGQINQGEYDKVIKRRIKAGSAMIKGAGKKIEKGAKSVKREASKIRKLASSIADKSAKKTIIEEIKKISSLATVVVTAGSEIKRATKTLRKQNRFISKQAILRPEPDVRAGVPGRAVQSPKEPGKLTVTFRGFPGAYWIIALEGRASEGYEMAMVYGCQVLPPFLQTPIGIETETSFIIARKRDIPQARIDKLIAYAKGLGINLTLDNILIPASFEGCTGRTLSPAS